MQEASSKTCEWLVDRRAGINAAGAWYFWRASKRRKAFIAIC
jgi:hypothetical protein